jgi:hypothetical protein
VKVATEKFTRFLQVEKLVWAGLTVNSRQTVKMSILSGWETHTFDLKSMENTQRKCRKLSEFCLFVVQAKRFRNSLNWFDKCFVQFC